jgi:hypothetical protein
VGIKTTGVKETILGINQDVIRTTRATRRQIREAAYEIEELSRKMTPELSGALTESHDVRAEIDDRHRRMMVIEFGDGLPYAIAVHEGTTGQAFGQGERSRAKAAENGVEVGPKFLERAAEELMPKIMADMEEAARKS